MWAQDALRAGNTLVYDTSVRVHHYHYQSFEYTYKRVLTQLYFAYQIFGLKQQLVSKKSQYLKIVYRNLKYKAHPKWIWHNFQIIHGRKKAFRDFHDWLGQGEEFLDKMYKQVCQAPPQGIQKND
ncbi:MAG: hypothetical protein HC819_18535 [Cyclobacteriaceae bacterium]|nr:hypothetical protein [Cyclobacteriaceae bacterium]